MKSTFLVDYQSNDKSVRYVAESMSQVIDMLQKKEIEHDLEFLRVERVGCLEEVVSVC